MSKLQPGIITEIPIDEVTPDLDQPRKAFPAKPLEDLAANIKARGILQPITVRPIAGVMVANTKRAKFAIVTGERRWRAAKLAGLKTVPVIFRETEPTDAQDVLIDQLAENDLREGLTPIERAQALQRLKDAGLGPKQIVDHLAKHGITMSRPAVSNSLRLLALPDSAKTMVSEGKLKESYARELLAIADHPKIVDAVCQEIADDKGFNGPLDAEWIREAITEQFGSSGAERVFDGDGCKDCKCMTVTKDFRGNAVVWCTAPETLTAKRLAAEAAETGKDPDAPAKPAKKAETDPTKVKPVKVNENEHGVVATNRRKHDTFESLSHAKFDTSVCDGCPHRHLAAYNPGAENGQPTCFYTPCFEHLQRQQQKVENRQQRIREIIDDQLLPHLVQTCSEPVARNVVTALLAYVAVGYPVMPRVPDPKSLERWSYGARAEPPQWDREPRSTRQPLLDAIHALQRGTLTAFLEAELSGRDAEHLVEAAVRSLDLEQRRELALYLSIDIASFWETTEAYAKLWTKPEIVALIGHLFDVPPDVPAGEWRDRLMLRPGVPDAVREVWSSPIANYWIREAEAVDVDDVDEQQAAA